MNRRASRLLPFVLLVALTANSTACGVSGTPRGAPMEPIDPVTNLRSPGTVLLLHCKSTMLTLIALSVDNGQTVATTSATLGDDSGPSHICGDPLSGDYPSTALLQQLLTPDAARIAGWVRGPGKEGFLATSFDTRTGTQVGPSLDPNGFTASPDDRRPVFHDGKLWYVDRDKRLRSRSPEQPPEAAEVHGTAGGSDVSFAGGDAWLNKDAGGTAIHPSGRYAAEVARFWGNLQIRERDAGRDDVAVLSEGTAAGADEPPPGSAPLPSCRPNFWLDDATLFCSSRSQIWKLTLTPDHRSVSKAEPLLPVTDRHTYGPVPAPDKNAFAFLVEHGDTLAVYRQALSPGAQPAKIADLPRPGNTYLLGWS
ncbi:hypothetical protein [Lentzea terrae]|uniref:hypothetical protein n=1 Tax=Lentzea terrae TaxID=2200761 RepID=UPI000DD40C01|nr:hypothetical protein [Lentzea terrae]